MKNQFKFAFLLMSLLLVLNACGKKYPELDAAVADKLQPSGIPGVFVTKINTKVEKDTTAVALHCAKACASIKRYFEYVTYPYTICTPPDFVLDEKVLALAKEVGQDSIAKILGDKQPYTHQVRNKAKFGIPSVWCRTVGGPWGAFLEDREFCGFCGGAPHQYTLTLPGLSNNLVWIWYGTMADRPADAPAMDHPSLVNDAIIDCDPTDPTNCGGSPGNGGVPTVK